MNKARRNPVNVAAAHGILILYTAVALFPVFVILINSFKSRRAIFREPLALPDADSFSTVGYQTVFNQGDFFLYFQKSLILTVASLFFVLLFGAMAAFAISEYRFRGNTIMAFYLALGIMIPIRVGTVAILELMVNTGLDNTLWALILVYTAQGLPPAVFNMIPIWSELWFPLILAPSEDTKTLTLGSQVFIGQFVTDWNAALSALSMAILPVTVLYVIFSRQLIRGITSGAVR